MDLHCCFRSKYSVQFEIQSVTCNYCWACVWFSYIIKKIQNKKKKKASFWFLGSSFLVKFVCVCVCVFDSGLTGNWRPLWVWANTMRVRESEAVEICYGCVFVFIEFHNGLLFSPMHGGQQGRLQTTWNTNLSRRTHTKQHADFNNVCIDCIDQEKKVGTLLTTRRRSAACLSTRAISRSSHSATRINVKASSKFLQNHK